ncbi:MAG: hypothetical protein LC754_06110 [Acidobacteria bacterium]|nr:hypothetical protein [Acidobacteriota bacterium]
MIEEMEARLKKAMDYFWNLEQQGIMSGPIYERYWPDFIQLLWKYEDELSKPRAPEQSALAI